MSLMVPATVIDLLVVPHPQVVVSVGRRGVQLRVDPYAGLSGHVRL